jgi:methylmalonyl-CoA mutase N-terminal domain/subunit
VQLTAQQPEVNLIRVTAQAMAAVFGGAQSLHTNAYDEAIGLPTEKAARLALRTQQVLAHETDLTATVDPFGGSYAIEVMTDEVEAAAIALIAKVDELGGAVRAIEAGFQKSEIEKVAYRTAQQIDSGERVVVGLNRYRLDTEEAYQPLRVDPVIEERARARLATLRRNRSAAQVQQALEELRHAAKDPHQNLLYPMKRALAARATVGEVCHALREVWGTYQPPHTL